MMILDIIVYFKKSTSVHSSKIWITQLTVILFCQKTKINKDSKDHKYLPFV